MSDYVLVIQCSWKQTQYSFHRVYHSIILIQYNIINSAMQQWNDYELASPDITVMVDWA